MTGPFGRISAALLLALLLGLLTSAASLAQGVDAQTAPKAEATALSSLDYTAWDTMAARAEGVIADRTVAGDLLEQMRAQLVDWRGAFLVAQSANSARIGSLRSQIESLGPAPAEGEGEAAEIANRRTELSDQLVRLQAPGIAADEAYSRADGLIREIDLRLRERQADELLRLWPAPINPANWPAAARALTAVAVGFWTETHSQWQKPDARTQLGDNFPLTLLFLAVAGGLLWRGRQWLERVMARLLTNVSTRGR